MLVPMTNSRLSHLKRYYGALMELERKLGGKHLLKDCDGKLPWPARGVYFFFEDGEGRSCSGKGLRVVRVGTHAVTQTSKTKLWNRLSQHKGTQKSGGGNHRGSIFRLIIGTSTLRKFNVSHESWGRGSSAPREVRDREIELEKFTSAIIGAMPFLWLDVDSPDNGPQLRAMIEQNSIALLSNFNKADIDAASPEWLGHHCDRERVRHSGLWNSNHVHEGYNPEFLDELESLIGKMEVRP